MRHADDGGEVVVSGLVCVGFESEGAVVAGRMCGVSVSAPLDAHSLVDGRPRHVTAQGPFRTHSIIPFPTEPPCHHNPTTNTPQESRPRKPVAVKAQQGVRCGLLWTFRDGVQGQGHEARVY